MEKKFIKEYIEDLLNDERDLIIIFNEINAKFLNESLPLVAKELFFTLRFLCNEFMLFTIRKEIIEIERFILDLENRNLLEPIFVPESDYYIFEPFIFHIAEYEIFSNVTYNYPLTQQSPTDKKLIDFQKLYLKNPISNDFETPNLYDYKNRLKNAYYLCEYFQKKTNLEIDFNFDNYHLYKNYFTDNPLIQNLLKNKEVKNSDKYPTDKYWFIVGLEFAKGKISLDIKNQNKPPNKIATKLGNKNYRPYIACTITNNSNGDNKSKNLFYSTDKPQQIIDYCKENSIDISKEFLDKFDNIKPL